MMHRIFIVDDEEIVIKGITAIIERFISGCEIAGSATDGISALNSIIDIKPDLLITDIRIPGMDGLSLIEQVREFLPQTECIVISGYTEFEYARRALQMGVRDYIDKPVTITKLQSAINNVDNIVDKEKSDDDQMGNFLPDTGHVAIDKVIKYINMNYCLEIGLNEAAALVGMNPAYLSVLFKENVGESFIKYLTRIRIDKAKLLLSSGMKVVDVSQKVGYSNYHYFCDIFKKRENMTPNEYKESISMK